MSNWSDYRPEETARAIVGKARCVIVDAEESVSKTSGNPMIIVTVIPNGYKIKVKNYIVKNQYFNRNITSFFDSFGIERGDFNMLGWIGAMGAAEFGEDDQGYTKITWWIKPEQARELPVWEGELPERQTVTDFKELEPDDVLPGDDLAF
jgi:hypothetical protein